MEPGAMPLQAGVGHRQIWAWPTAAEEQRGGHEALLASGSTSMPVADKSEASARACDDTGTGEVTEIPTDLDFDLRTVVRYSDLREESKISHDATTDFQDTERHVQLTDLPNEVLYEILSHLDVCDLFSASKVSSSFLFLDTIYVSPLNLPLLW